MLAAGACPMHYSSNRPSRRFSSPTGGRGTQLYYRFHPISSDRASGFACDLVLILLVTIGHRGGYDLFALVARALGCPVHRVHDVELPEFVIVSDCPFFGIEVPCGLFQRFRCAE